MYTVRVELHGDGHAANYKDLHQLMEAAGFKRSYEGADLPPAEYIGGPPQTDHGEQHVANVVKEHAARVQPPVGTSVIVTKWGNFALDGDGKYEDRNKRCNVFTVRIELHGVKDNEGKYFTLHKFMRDAGFSHTIDGDNGLPLFLPSAEYRGSPKSDYEIRNLANALRAKIIEEVHPPGGVTVMLTESLHLSAQGLETAVFHLSGMSAALLDDAAVVSPSRWDPLVAQCGAMVPRHVVTRNDSTANEQIAHRGGIKCSKCRW